MADLQNLLDDLASGDEDRAQAAVPALTMHGSKAVQALASLVRSPIADRRWWAAYALAAFQGDRLAQDLLIQTLEDSTDAVRQCAALALKQNPTASAVEPLVRLMRGHDRLAARLAGDALGAVGVAAVPALTRASKDPNPGVRIEAVRALAQMKHPDAIGPLFNCLDDPSSVVSLWAEEGLDRLGIGMIFFKP